MCHGVFDVVHPGHVRHLLYAKSKADILVASITADKHITKGLHRPHVPQDLRAVNLAAFEMVDYVVIDRNDKPLANIEAIQPDYFAKGFEYNATGTCAEDRRRGGDRGGLWRRADLHAGRHRLFLERADQPGAALDEAGKLQIVMERNETTFDHLRDALGRMPGAAGARRRRHDRRQLHPLRHDRRPDQDADDERTVTSADVDYVGGAGIVAKHLIAAGAEVTFSTVLGDDGLKAFAVDDMRAAGIDVRAVIDASRPTVNKNAIVVGGYRLLKVDTLDNRSISDNILAIDRRRC